MSAPLLAERSVELVVDTPADRIEIEADPNRLAQIIVNLLSNAVRHGKDGGHIWLTVEGAGAEAEIRVRDDGQGMDAAVLRRAFELFAQGPVGQAGNSGLGVGLALVRQLVELHAGSVEARSEGAGKGSEFIVRLPMLGRRPAPARALASPEAPEASPRSRKVMVVDDNADAAEMLATMLEVRGHRVSIARDGVDALEHARSSVPDAMLLDIEMPRMNGYEVARAVRTDPRLAALRLIAISGYGQERDRDRSKQAGFDVHMIKPVDIKALYAALEGSA